jgi:hypothetical protein
MNCPYCNADLELLQENKRGTEFQCGTFLLHGTMEGDIDPACMAKVVAERDRLKQQERILKRLATYCRGFRFKVAPFSDDPQGHGQEDEYERILEYVEPEEGWPQEVLP